MEAGIRASPRGCLAGSGVQQVNDHGEVIQHTNHSYANIVPNLAKIRVRHTVNWGCVVEKLVSGRRSSYRRHSNRTLQGDIDTLCSQGVTAYGAMDMQGKDSLGCGLLVAVRLLAPLLNGATNSFRP